MTRRSRPGTEAGFTLIELMISLTLFSLALGGVLSVAVTMSKGYRDQRIIVATEGSVRTSMDVLADVARGASPGVPTGNIQHVNTCATGALTVVNNSNAPDELIAVYGLGATTTLRSTYGSGTTSVTVANASSIFIGDTILISDLDQGHLATIASVDSSTSTLSIVPQSCGTLALPAGGYPAGSLVMVVARARFFVGAVDGVPTLMIDPDAEGPAAAEPLAEGIEDLQIAVGVDTNGDNLVSEVGATAGDDEWSFNTSGETLLAGSLRAIRITLVARATKPIVNATDYVRPAAEDRAAAGSGDGYRRRSLTSIIEVRNLGGSP